MHFKGRVRHHGMSSRNVEASTSREGMVSSSIAPCGKISSIIMGWNRRRLRSASVLAEFALNSRGKIPEHTLLLQTASRRACIHFLLRFLVGASPLLDQRRNLLKKCANLLRTACSRGLALGLRWISLRTVPVFPCSTASYPLSGVVVGSGPVSFMNPQ